MVVGTGYFRQQGGDRGGDRFYVPIALAVPGFAVPVAEKAAEVQLENVLAVDSRNQLAYESLARLYYDRGRLEDRSYLVLADLVVTQAQRVLEADGVRSADLYNIRGLLWMQRDDPARAIRA